MNVTPSAVQTALREVFGQWGLPARLRVDNGYPWGSSGDLPTDLCLWLVGLGVQMVFNRPCHPQENGCVERAHGTLGAWAEPGTCRDVGVLQTRLAWAGQVQRSQYPSRHGHTRVQAYPALAGPGGAYAPQEEAAQWDLPRVQAYLAPGLWPRKVDKVGRISLYNRAVGVGRRYVGQTVSVRLDPEGGQWIILDASGREIIAHPAAEISPERIMCLDVTHHRTPAHKTQRAQLAVAAQGV